MRRQDYMPPLAQPNPATYSARRDFAMAFRWHRIGMEGNEIMLQAIAYALEAPAYPFGMSTDDIELYIELYM